VSVAAPVDRRTARVDVPASGGSASSGGSVSRVGTASRGVTAPWRLTLDASLLLSAVVALVFFLPARAVVSGMGAAGRPHFILAIGLLVWWLLCQLHPRLRVRSLHPLVVLVLVYVGWLTLAWAAGYDRGLTAGESSGSDRAMIANFAYLGVVLVAATGLTSRRRIDVVLRTVVAGAAFSAVFGWIQFFANRDLTVWLMLPGFEANQPLVGISARGADQFARVAGTAGHYIEFGVVCAMVLPVAVHYARSRPAGMGKLAWLAVILIGGAVPFSLSRSAIVAFALSAAVMLIGWPRRTRWNAIGALLLAVPVYMVVKPGLLGTLKSLFLNAATDPSITGRTNDYATVWRYIVQRPWAGRGPGTFTPEQYILLDNQWLLSLVETGWVGVAILATIFIASIRVLLNVRRRARLIGDERLADLALSLVAIVVTVPVTAAFFDAFSFTTATTVLWLTVGVAAALSTQQRRRLAVLGIPVLTVPQRWRALVDVARGRPVDDPAGHGSVGWI